VNIRPILATSALFLTLSTLAVSQDGYHFGIKAGPTFGTQTWNEAERNFLLDYHASVFVESRDLEDKGSLYAMLGYHARGSSLRFQNFFNGSNQSAGYIFKNLALQVGARKPFLAALNVDPYYFVGIRGEYQLDNNLDDIIMRFCQAGQFVCPFPDPFFVNKFTAGITIGGGVELTEGKFFQPCLEFSISPDLTFQYQQPELGRISNPQGGTTTIGEREIRNVTFELTLVLKFLREIIYYE